MKLLVLGGTLFLGRHVVAEALARGHAVTLFHRGRTQPDLFPAAERILGDRERDLEALDGRTWDAVVDTSGYLPSVVRASATRLAGAAGYYAFVSSISVYAALPPRGGDESAPVQAMPAGAAEQLTGDTYGALKALCEREVEAAFPGRALHVRAGLLVGPHDPTDRFTWWVRRVARGGDVLAPGDPAGPVQMVDARDLAAWIVAMTERAAGGVFNATGPRTPLTFGAMLDACREATGSDARFTWVDEAFLLERGVTPWSEMPLWLPRAHAGMVSVDARRAWASGLAFRPLVETARDTWRWDRDTPVEARPPKPGLAMAAGMSPEREAALWREWHERFPAGES